MESEFISKSPAETISVGKKIGKKLKAGDILCLKGDLGAGKTHFVKGIAEALNINPDEVLSPTYTLIHEYEGTLPLYHFDCYRMESPREALEIGVEEYFYGAGICVIEWPERITSLIPPEALWITIEIADRETRKFVIGKNSL
ncbi:tRNA (adenosine(37)-N6)-threonylcarbamoyltransferase complex ATPase subunit type 1 TsaE [Aliifodinibius salicampi]|uniref:tRNA threonylcarbamoyladenosine biosynthesis protein TsaE n=1 Tax=Fodinibius salicampi TaxID=1920655 RepID=A0ABT3Q367_9BACT|nr:tRNA (adenosine(37)-N6)-threonylcarbamoyltransferase complex ATPase subunit type 1 TsaE [Fodinibius salicampi]MCW9714453.1 tRNA (adenosine(37)-N6)-threonylcarbamoyltransferase complex ATPase subunit type 1 TsaE [Fodinibius salicampi]